MLPPQSFKVVQAESLRIPITIADGAGNPIDLSGATAHFGVARVAGEATVLSTLASPPTVVTSFNSPPTDGVVNVAVESEDTAALIGTYEWECRVIDSNSRQTAVARGYLTFWKRVVAA